MSQNNVKLSGSEQKKLEMKRVISSFADGPVNFNPTGPAEDQTQKLISSTGIRLIKNEEAINST